MNNEKQKYPKYQINEPVIYQYGDYFKLGIVKAICENDGYFINFHTGDTAARIHASNLHKIINKYAFHIYRLDTNDKERKENVR